MDKIITIGHYAEPIAVQKIIKGKLIPITNEVTGKTTITGGGTVLFDISADRQSPHFLLKYVKR